jgi:hypothetical protein
MPRHGRKFVIPAARLYWVTAQTARSRPYETWGAKQKGRRKRRPFSKI